MTRPLDVNSDDLRLLLALLRTGRMVTAGAALGLDHTTVSRRLRRLEASLGVALIVQGVDGWHLTPRGMQIAERAAPLDRIMQDVRSIAGGNQAATRETVRIAAPEGFGVHFVVPATARVLARHPELAVEVVTRTRPLASRGAGFDMAVSIGESPSSRLISSHLADYALQLYRSETYSEGLDPIDSIDALREHSLIFYVDSMLSVAELDLVHHFSGQAVGFASTSVMAQLAATRAGAGIGLLPAFLAQADNRLIPVLPDLVRFELTLSVSVRNGPALPYVDEIRSELAAEVLTRGNELIP